MAEFDFNTLRAAPTEDFDFNTLRAGQAPDDRTKADRAALRARLIAEQRDLENQDSGMVLGTIKELGSMVGEAGAEQAANLRAGGEYVRAEPTTPLIPIPKPEAKLDESKTTQFAKGVARAGIGAVETLESPVGAVLAASGAVPTIGPMVVKGAATLFGLHSLYDSFKRWYSGQITTPQQAGEAVGNAAIGALALKGGLSKGEVAPAEAAKEPTLSTQEANIAPSSDAAPIIPPIGEGPSTITSIKNAVVDQERAERGIPEAEPVLKSSFGAAWDEAKARIDSDPTYQDKLLNELRSKPRALTDVEDATLLHRQVELQNAFDKAQSDIGKAYEAGDEAARFEAFLRFSTLSDQLLDIYDIGKKVGTETGRGLAARRMLSQENFTLARMVTETRAAKGGRHLTEEEMADVTKQHEEIKRTQSELDQHIASQEDLTAIDEGKLKLQAASERAKELFQQTIEAEKRSKRTVMEQAQDTFVKWRRGFILSSPVTIGKLFAAALSRMVITPAEEAVGSAIGKAIPSIAEKAKMEGGFSLNAEVKAITSAFTKGMADAWDTLRTGRSNLDRVYGETRLMEPEAIDFFGHLHGAMKAPVKRAAFSRAFAKATEFDMRNGVDVSDPLVQTKNAVLAYKEANKSIFQQDNRVVELYNRGVATLQKPDPKTGEVSTGAKTLATILQTLLPIVKVPSNITHEAAQYATGAEIGLYNAGKALVKGAENLSEDEANLIMRQLKKGSLGSALLLLGYFGYKDVGGFYQQGQKRSPDDVKATEARIGGQTIPASAMHNPAMENIQLGATIRRVAESKLRKKDEDMQGLPAGVLAGALGLAEEVPFVRETVEVAKAYDPYQRGNFFGELAKSIVVPQALQWAARQMDKDAAGDVTLRKPTTLMEHIKTGIPVLRQEVPEKKEPEKLTTGWRSLLKE